MYSRAYVEITNICNMNCSFCHGHSRPPRRMTGDEFAHILDGLQDVTQYVYYHLMGEPLTHPDLPAFLHMAAEKGFRSIITTNGTLLQRRTAELLSAPIHKVSISVHSFEEGSDETFTRYLTDITDFADLASQKGIIVALRLWNLGHDGGRNERILSFLRNRFPEGDWKENWKGIRIRDKLHLEYGDRFVWPDKDALADTDEVFCYGMLDHFGILCDGSVVPCCLDSEGVITLGNAFTESISDILTSPRAKAMINGFRCRKATEDMCRRCGYARRF